VRVRADGVTTLCEIATQNLDADMPRACTFDTESETAKIIWAVRFLC
jgi:hypothetical protein